MEEEESNDDVQDGSRMQPAWWQFWEQAFLQVIESETYKEISYLEPSVDGLQPNIFCASRYSRWFQEKKHIFSMCVKSMKLIVII